MAQVDVSDLLLDPDFIDAMTLVHRTFVIDDFGVNQLTEVTQETFGSVQPISGRDLQRLPEALRMADVRTFFIKAQIQSDGASQYPDKIVFQGFTYQVQTTTDWLNFGQGWNSGTCVREKPSS